MDCFELETNCFEQSSFTKTQLAIIKELVFNSPNNIVSKIKRDYYQEYSKLITKLRKIPELEFAFGEERY